MFKSQVTIRKAPNEKKDEKHGFSDATSSDMTDSAAAVATEPSISSSDFSPDNSSTSFSSLQTSVAKRLGQNSAPSKDEMKSIRGQSVHSIVESARTSARGSSNLSGTGTFSLCKLNLGHDSFIERSKEKSMLLDAYERVRRNDPSNTDGSTSTSRSRPSSSSSFPEVVLVHGYSGAGKTVLVQTTLKSQRDKQFYLEGKFDLHQRAARPFAAIIDALSDLPRQIAQLSNFGEAMKTAIAEAIGDDSDVITSVIPSMSQLFGGGSVVDSDKDSRTCSPDDKNRQTYIFRKLFRVVGSPSCPLVLFLDDLQWADEASVELIESLATDGNTGSTVIVGTYRDNEVDDEHILVKMQRSIEKRRADVEGVAVTDVFLGNLSDSEVNALVSMALRSTEDDTKSLSNIVLSKTSGNPFFVTQFLLVLHSEELLKFNLGTLKWQWDEEAIMSKQVSSNVSDLTRVRLLELTPEEQNVLMVGACLGNEFHTHILALALGCSDSNHDTDLEDTLKAAVHIGILRLVDGKSLYAFVHDQIQHAAFCLIPEEERAPVQGRAGTSIIQNAAPDELSGDLLLVAVDLANCDALSFTALDGYGKAELASLNLRAGKQAIKIAAYAIAASYFEAGMVLLDEDAFTNNYQLILDLYTLAARAHYCNGNFDRCNRCLDMVLERHLAVEDRLPGYLIRLTVLFVTNQHNKGMPLTKKIFGELGYSGFPKNVSTFAILKDFLKTKRLVNKHKGTIADVPLCEDKNRVIAMGLLDVMVGICYITNDPALSLVVFRILRWSIKYGLCSHSGTGFTMYGVILCTMGDLQGGFEIGQVAAAVHKRLKEEHDITTQRMYILEGMINHYTLPIQMRGKACLEIYEDSMRAGDTESAMWAILHCSCFGWFSSMNLDRLDEKIMKPHCQIIYDYKIIITWRTLITFRQTVLNLSGKSKDPLVLTGEAMNQEDMLKDAFEEKNLLVSNVINSLRMELAYSFGEYESAAKLLDELQEPEICYPAFYQGIRQKMFEGLTCFAMARIVTATTTNGRKHCSRQKRTWTKRGFACVKLFEKLTKAGNVNTTHVLHLLNAEAASLRANVMLATGCYDKAVAIASRNGFVQDRALAHERCALFYLNGGANDKEWASHHMKEAIKSYADWGATSKVDYLSQRYHHLLG